MDFHHLRLQYIITSSKFIFMCCRLAFPAAGATMKITMQKVKPPHSPWCTLCTFFFLSHSYHAADAKKAAVTALQDQLKLLFFKVESNFKWDVSNSSTDITKRTHTSCFCAVRHSVCLAVDLLMQLLEFSGRRKKQLWETCKKYTRIVRD